MSGLAIFVHSWKRSAIRKIKKYEFTAILIIGSIVLFAVFTGAGSYPKRLANSDPVIAFDSFAGSASCRSCHQAIYDSSVKTAHYFTSRPAQKAFIKGSFDSGRNHFTYNKFMEVVLESEGDSAFQTAIMGGVPIRSEAFGMVIGSGRKGQTYLYWNGRRLFQLPVSYYTPQDSWCNSPGFSLSNINFNRPIPGQCIECHGTYASTETEGGATLYDRKKILYGVDCERCHGPSAAHVAFHTAHGGEKIGRFVINTKPLDRQIRLDACALCHSGFRKALRPAFTFVAGKYLNEYSSVAYNADTAAQLDVHGNQYGLLTSSKCFRNDASMDCSSCHNVHNTQFNQPTLFSEKCKSCHNGSTHLTCSFIVGKDVSLSQDCVQCHMPLIPSKKIFLQMADSSRSTADLVRTHRIAIYPAVTGSIIAKLKATKQ